MLDKNRNYMVLNYSTSPVAVSTMRGSVLIPAGADNDPSGIPFSLEDITYINMTTSVFKTGALWFEPQFENEIYNDLRIFDSDNILTNQEIEDIIINPTAEKLEAILSIDNPMYFERIYGTYIGLRNEGVSMSGKIQDLMNARMIEFRNGKRKTGIQVKPVQSPDDAVKANMQEVEDLKKQIAEMQEAMKQMMSKDKTDDYSATTKKTTAKKSSTTKKDSSNTTE